MLIFIFAIYWSIQFVLDEGWVASTLSHFVISIYLQSPLARFSR